MVDIAYEMFMCKTGSLFGASLSCFKELSKGYNYVKKRNMGFDSDESVLFDIPSSIYKKHIYCSTSLVTSYFQRTLDPSKADSQMRSCALAMILFQKTYCRYLDNALDIAISKVFVISTALYSTQLLLDPSKVVSQGNICAMVTVSSDACAICKLFELVCLSSCIIVSQFRTLLSIVFHIVLNNALFYTPLLLDSSQVVSWRHICAMKTVSSYVSVTCELCKPVCLSPCAVDRIFRIKEHKKYYHTRLVMSYLKMTLDPSEADSQLIRCALEAAALKDRIIYELFEQGYLCLCDVIRRFIMHNYMTIIYAMRRSYIRLRDSSHRSLLTLFESTFKSDQSTASLQPDICVLDGTVESPRRKSGSGSNGRRLLLDLMYKLSCKVDFKQARFLPSLQPDMCTIVGTAHSFWRKSGSGSVVLRLQLALMYKSEPHCCSFDNIHNIQWWSIIYIISNNSIFTQLLIDHLMVDTQMHSCAQETETIVISAICELFDLERLSPNVVVCLFRVPPITFFFNSQHHINKHNFTRRFRDSPWSLSTLFAITFKSDQSPASWQPNICELDGTAISPRRKSGSESKGHRLPLVLMYILSDRKETESLSPREAGGLFKVQYNILCFHALILKFLSYVNICSVGFLKRQRRVYGLGLDQLVLEDSVPLSKKPRGSFRSHVTRTIENGCSVVNLTTLYSIPPSLEPLYKIEDVELKSPQSKQTLDHSRSFFGNQQQPFWPSWQCSNQFIHSLQCHTQYLYKYPLQCNTQNAFPHSSPNSDLHNPVLACSVTKQTFYPSSLSFPNSELHNNDSSSWMCSEIIFGTYYTTSFPNSELHYCEPTAWIPNSELHNYDPSSWLCSGTQLASPNSELHNSPPVLVCSGSQQTFYPSSSSGTASNRSSHSPSSSSSEANNPNRNPFENNEDAHSANNNTSATVVFSNSNPLVINSLAITSSNSLFSTIPIN